MKGISRSGLHGLLLALREGFITIEQTILFFEEEFNSRTQVIKPWQEIRADWFDEHLVYRGVKVTKPEWIERTVKERTIKFSRNEARERFGKMAINVKLYIKHYRTTLNLSYAPNMEYDSALARPTMSNKELGQVKARITREVKKSRKLVIAERLANQPNATARAIERLAFMTMYQSM